MNFNMPTSSETPRSQYLFSGLFFVFDVESIGLAGEGFAVAGGVYNRLAAAQMEFAFCCPEHQAQGTEIDRKWVCENVPRFPATHDNPRDVRTAFWETWRECRSLYSGIQMAAECQFPVETRFLARCVDDLPARSAEAPYPLLEISTYMQAAGMDPMATYDRLERERPRHHPLADARQSARLLAAAIARLCPEEQ
jgi:hypothetical protein